MVLLFRRLTFVTLIFVLFTSWIECVAIEVSINLVGDSYAVLGKSLNQASQTALGLTDLNIHIIFSLFVTVGLSVLEFRPIEERKRFLAQIILLIVGALYTSFILFAFLLPFARLG